MSGHVVHFEIPADDTERAAGFYRNTFGWDLQPQPGMDYTMVITSPTDERGMPSQPGSINGGMFQRNPQLGTPVITIDVEDIDATLRKVEELGGSTVMAKQPVGEMGFIGYFRDSEGNVMGLWQNAAPEH